MTKILLIEDDDQLCRMMQFALIKAGHVVTMASNGVDGIRRHREAPADLVITDIFMPEEDGLGVIMALRRETPSVAMIAMSGCASRNPDWLDIAARIGAMRTLAKPFLAQELIELVAKVLAERAGRTLPPQPSERKFSARGPGRRMVTIGARTFTAGPTSGVRR